MKVLITGANGFIGRYLLARLQQAGHTVVPAVRRPAETDRLLRRPGSLKVDMNRDLQPDDWLARLDGIDAVINCAGILQGGIGQSITAIHDAAPRGLFAACERAGVERVIQISAVSATDSAGTDYATSKKAADDFLARSALNWVVLRPSLVYADGAYGGTALLRGLACLPFAVPLVGDGSQAFQPIHIDDLTETVLRLLETPAIGRLTIEPVGPERLTLRDILLDLRRWLGMPPAPTIAIPLPVVQIMARLGDIFGGTINTTALRQLLAGNDASPEPFVRDIGITPRRWQDALLAQPAQPQDRWHAKLYLLRPVLRVALALMWLASGIIGLGLSTERLTALMAPLHLHGSIEILVAWATSLLDVVIGLALLARWRPTLLAAIQAVVIVGYSVVLTGLAPGLWFDPFGPLLKNVPILVSIAVLGVLEHER